jgi:hypothetical protein
MQWARLLLRLFGWLLTPFMAWAASFFGCVAGEVIATRIGNPHAGLGLSIGLGAICGFGGLILWLRLLRHSPELQEALAVTEEGVPESAAAFLDHVEDDVTRDLRE